MVRSSFPSSARKRIAFVCAMPLELKPLKRKLSLEKASVETLEIYTGCLGQRPVVAMVTGIGSILAAQRVERLLETIDIEQVVVVGITGAVDDETPIGALVLPAIVVNARTGTEYRPTPLGEGVSRGKMWTADELITDPDVLSNLRANGVISLDMETAAIAEVCQHRNIPWSVFRAVSDRAAEVSLDDEVMRLVNRDGTYNVRRIGAFFVKHPGRVAALSRLARNAKLAAENAAAATVDAFSLGSP
jgi:adenosylhomocysteine nucleosidase